MTSEHNDTYYQTSEQRPIRNEFDSKRIVKRDFWLIPTYLVMNIVFPLILTFIVMGIISGITGGHISESKFTKYYLGYAQVFTLIGQCLVLVVFYLMHRKTIIPIAISRFKALKKTYSTHYHCDGGPLCVARRIWLFNGIFTETISV